MRGGRNVGLVVPEEKRRQRNFDALVSRRIGGVIALQRERQGIESRERLDIVGRGIRRHADS